MNLFSTDLDPVVCAEVKACLQCGNPCTNKKRTFCSQKCRGVHRSLNTTKRIRWCEAGCGTQCKNMYRRFCSSKCWVNSKDARIIHAKTHLGRKQSEEQVKNRVAKTDQKAKEAKRKSTMLKKFGVDNYGATPEHRAHLASAYLGKKQARTKCQQQNIIAAKRRNGTINHSARTRRRISAGVLKTFSDPSFDRSVFVSKVFNPFTGYYNGIYYRSSYELMFLKFCRKYFIDVVPAGTKTYAVHYVDSIGSERVYYPDFYLPEFDRVIEIKPNSMITFGSNPQKFLYARRKYQRFTVLTELSGYTDRKAWKKLYYGLIMEWCGEHLCYGL